jgi:hypothetical protein
MRSLPARLGDKRREWNDIENIREALMTIPRQPDTIPAEESEKQISPWRLDLAYACFAFLGLAVAAFASMTFADKENQAGYGMLSLTLVPPTLAAFVAGIVLTVKSWRHRPLVVLCLTTLLFVGVLVGAGVSDCCSEGASAKAIGATPWIYGAVAILVPLWWFIVGRWNNKDEPLLQP